MRKLAVLLLCLLFGGLLVLDASAQEPDAFYFHQRQFKLPFNVEQKNVVQVRLYVSSDQGRTWHLTANAAPEDRHFVFSAPSDGMYYFAVQTVFPQNKMVPQNLEDLRANRRVMVDTLPPAVQVNALAPRGGEVGVAWQVRDLNLDLTLPDAIRVEYRPPGAANWIPLAVPPGASQLYWNPQTNAQIEVRVSARDRAGNVGSDKTTVTAVGNTGAGGAVNPPPFQQPLANDAFKDLQRTFVNNKQISLNYDLRDVGPSGVSAVELWYTLYQGRVWNKLTEYPIDLKNAADARESKKLTFEVQDEGIYGITLVAKSGVGLGAKPPQPGERPQFWIEVDLTKPDVKMHDILVGNGFDKGKLNINWTARDKNLGPNPIRLSYSVDKSEWNTIADKLANNGRYIWRMPEGLPYQFYVRVEAIDLAGNIGEAITQERVKVDLSLPKAVISGIAPSGQ
jgi:hypothetical protein